MPNWSPQVDHINEFMATMVVLIRPSPYLDRYNIENPNIPYLIKHYVIT